jgi:hypothetical protein
MGALWALVLPIALMRGTLADDGCCATVPLAGVPVRSNRSSSLREDTVFAFAAAATDELGSEWGNFSAEGR